MTPPIARARVQARLGKPSQLCGRFAFPSDAGATPFGSLFEVDTAPHFLLGICGCVDVASPTAIYALLFDALDPNILPPRAFFSIGPIPAGGTFLFSEFVTEWWGLAGTDGGQLEGRQPMAGWPIDHGLIVAASTTPLVLTAPLGDFLSIKMRGQR